MSARTNSRLMHRLRDEFFLEGKQLDADPDTRHLSVCWLCRGRIDYDADPGTTPDSHNLDHYHPVKDRPDLQLDHDNFRHAHTLCNQNRGASTPLPGLGEEMPAWW